MTPEELAAGRCAPQSGPPLGAARADELLALLPGWKAAGSEIVREYRFRDYEQTLAFVNAVARIAQEQDHHPDIAFGYNRCRIAYSTHSVGGLSINDFICAAKVEALPRP